MKTPEEVAREWINTTPETEDGAVAERLLADLIRREREEKWEAAVKATETLHQVSGFATPGVDSTGWGDRCSDFHAARRAAIEGEP
jgi:hypothetical protein